MVRAKRGARRGRTVTLLVLLAFGTSIFSSCADGGSEDRTPQIVEALSIGDVDTLRTILKNTPSAVKARDRDKKTFLHLCGAHPVMSGAYMKRAFKESRNIEQDFKNWRANSKVMAELLISYGANVNAKDVFSRAPLHVTAGSGNIEVAKVLLENRADVNAKDIFGSTALHIVASVGNTGFARCLIDNGADVNARDRFGTPLTTAAENHRDMVELLLNSKADVHMKTKDGFAPIHLAGSRDIAQLLFARGAMLETKGYEGRTPLHQAAMRNRPDIVEWLCARGVNVNAVDSAGETPLTISLSQPDTEAAIQNNAETIRILVSYGADINCRTREGKTVLHNAVARKRKDVIDLLLKRGGDINSRDKYGYTPLHWAVSSKSKEMVQLLVDHGADVNARNLQGKTPLYYTWGGSGKDREIAEILKSRGGTGGS